MVFTTPPRGSIKSDPFYAAQVHYRGAADFGAKQNLSVSQELKGSALRSGPQRSDYSREVLTNPENSSNENDIGPY